MRNHLLLRLGLHVLCHLRLRQRLRLDRPRSRLEGSHLLQMRRARFESRRWGCIPDGPPIVELPEGPPITEGLELSRHLGSHLRKHGRDLSRHLGSRLGGAA